MGKVVVITQPKVIELQDYEELPLAPGEVRLRTLYSGISAGTELTAYRGSNVYLHKRWNEHLRLFQADAAPSKPYPLVGWGYEESGEVVEIGSAVSRIKIGDRIGGTWGHKTTHIADEEWAYNRIIPSNLPSRLGIFTHIGPIALNGILDAEIHIGETVAIFGLGIPGQIAARLAKLSGARVIGVDLYPGRLDLARKINAIDVAVNPTNDSPAEVIKDLTNGKGADVSIEISGSAKALQEAIRATAYSSRVVCLGFIQGAANDLYLGEEFHHNRIQIVCSQIGGISPALTGRWDRVRLIRTIYDLQASGQLDLDPLITHVLPFSEASEAYRTVDENPAEALQVVLSFEGG